MNNKFIKNKIKYKKGGVPPYSNVTGKKFNTQENKKKTTYETVKNFVYGKNDIELQPQQVNALVESLKNLINLINIPDENIKLKNNDPKAVCQDLSKLEILLNFNKNFYKALHTCFNGQKLKVDGIDLMKKGKFNILLFNKLIHGKLNTKWPPKKQIEVLKKELKNFKVNSS